MDRASRSLAAMPIRVVVAEDNYLVREAVTRLLEAEPRHRGRRRVRGLRRAARRGRAEHARRRAHRHPHAAHRHRRRRARRRAAARVAPASSAWSCSASTSSPRYALALLERRLRAARLPAEGAGVRRRPARPRAIREVAGGGSVIDPKVVEALVDARSRRADSPLAASPRARARCSAEMAQGRNNAVGRRRARPVGAGGREAHQLGVLQARPVRGARRPPPGEGRAAVPRRPCGRRPARVHPHPAWVVSAPCRLAVAGGTMGPWPDPVPVLIVDDQAPFRRAARAVVDGDARASRSSARPRAARRRSSWPTRSPPASCSWTSTCPASTASRRPAGSPPPTPTSS